MMFPRQENGLKGQYIIAQGKRSDALGWKAGREIVRTITFIKGKIFLRTSEMTLCFPEMVSGNSVRKELFALFIESSRTVFLLHRLPGAAFRIVPPEAMPRAIISWPFRPEKHSIFDLCIKDSSRERGAKSP